VRGSCVAVCVAVRGAMCVAVYIAMCVAVCVAVCIAVCLIVCPAVCGAVCAAVCFSVCAAVRDACAAENVYSSRIRRIVGYSVCVAVHVAVRVAENVY